MKWTEEEDRYIAAHSNEGVEAVRLGLCEEFGVLRSASAVERHGLRIGVSWQRWEVCPLCGQKVRRLNRLSGHCERCHWRALADRRRLLKEELKPVDASADKRRYKREAEALRYARGKTVNMSA